MESESERPTIWLVDPFICSPEEFEKTAQSLNYFFRPDERILPLYLWKGHLHFDSPSLERELPKKSDAILDLWMKPLLRATLLPTQVLPAGHGRPADDAVQLSQFVHRHGGGLVVGVHHPRVHAFQKILRSFTENVALAPSMSIIVLPLGWSPPTPDAPKILFTTDFSRPSRHAFSSALAFAKQKTWSITVYHKVEYPIFPVTEFAFAVPPLWAAAEEKLIEGLRNSADQFARRAKKAGVACDIKIDSSRGTLPSAAIEKESKRGYALVAIAAHSGFLKRAWGGSSSRRMLRQSTIPVWVIHSRAPKRKKFPFFQRKSTSGLSKTNKHFL